MDYTARFEYRVIPAPRTGLSRKGLKKTEDKFAFQLETLMNESATEGWEFVRAETLPCEERVGLTSKTERFQNVLVFRRELVAAPVAENTTEARAEPAFRAQAQAARQVSVPPAPLAADAPEAEPASEPASEPVTAPPRVALAPRQTADSAGDKPVLGLMRVIKGTRNEPAE
jgi:hypothetical protein